MSEQFLRTATPVGLGQLIRRHVATVPPGELDSLTITLEHGRLEKQEDAAE